MKKLLVMLVALVVSACGGNNNASSSAGTAMIDPGAAPVPKNAKYILKTAHSAAPDPNHPHHAALIYFKQNVETITKGEVGVEIYPLSSLGSGVDVLPQLENGTIAVIFEANRIFSGFFPETQAMDIPFLLPDPAEAVASQFLDSEPLAKLYTRTIKKRFPNISVQGFSLYGFRQIESTKPVTSYADLKGLKMRTTGAAIHEEFYKTLGMVPVTVPWQENYTALSTGVAEGLHNPLGDVLGSQLEDHLKHVYLDNSLLHSAVWMVSDTAMNQLPKELREQVLGASDMARQYLKMRVFANEYLSIDMMKAKGVTFTKITPEDMARTAKIKQDITAWFIDKYGPDAKTFLDQIQRYIATAQDDVKKKETLGYLK